MSLLFAAGERPDAAAIAGLSQSSLGFSISHLSPGEGLAGEEPLWLELVANGLTFEIKGLAGGVPAPPPPVGHRYGLPPDLDGARLRAVTLHPGRHVAAGATMPPVLRGLALLAARLAVLPGACAVVWHPARCWSLPSRFRDAVLGWFHGGQFPAYYLAALRETGDGGMQSEGLAVFIGQELRLEPELVIDQAEAGKLALRLLHWLCEHGRVGDARSVAAGELADVRLEPSGNGRFVRAWKQ